MATPKQLDISSPGGGDYSDDTSPFSPSLSRRKSPRNPASKRGASETVAEEETKKKKKKKKKKTKHNKLASPMSNRIWSEEDELAILKGLVDYRAKTGFESKIGWDAFYRFVGCSIVAKVSKEQLFNKFRKLKNKFLIHLEKIDQGIDPHFTMSSDSEAFGFSMMIWGKNEVEYANGGRDKAHLSESGEEMFKEDEEVANAKLLYDNGTAKSHDEVFVDKITENRTAGKESHDNDDNDEVCAVGDAFETMISQGLSDYQKKLQLGKLMNLGTEKRRELSSGWKALCVEECKLNIKKLRFSAKLAEATIDT